MAQAYISLASNSGDRCENINRAVWSIAAIKGVRVQRVSGIYEALCHELPHPAAAYYAVIRIESELSPEQLLAEALKIQLDFSQEQQEDEKTVIDIDLLYYEGQERNTRELILPHPEIENRPHIICPLLNLYADKRLKDRLRELGEDKVKYTGAGLYLPL